MLELKCTRCGETKPASEFHKQSSSPRGYKYHCRRCTEEYRRQHTKENPHKRKEWKAREYQNNRERYINSATNRKRSFDERSLGGKWKSEVAALYRQARVLSYQTGVKHDVDHVIPLINPHVCGLHVPWNLQVIPHDKNMAKGNTWEPWWAT